jgi:hypothetical protein
MTKGVVYVLSNPAMDGYIKIGKTTNLEQRLKSLDNTSTPLPFRCIFAIEVEDMDQVERLAHQAFKRDRVRSNREFFEIDEEQAVAALKMTGGRNVTPANDLAEDDEALDALDKATQKRSRFKFSMLDIRPGEELEYVRDSSVIAKVIDDISIEVDGNVTSLSQAALELLHREGIEWKTVAGPKYWTFGGVTLSELRHRLEDE